MLKTFFLVTFSFETILAVSSCGLDCVDKKTGMHTSSRTLEESRTKELLRFEFIADKSSFQLDSGLVFNIKNAWVENSWMYECIDNKAEVVKDSSYQFVIDAEYKGDAINSNFWIGNNHLGAVLRFDYSGQNTFKLALYKDTSFTLTNYKWTAGSITFVRRKVSR